MRRLPPQRRETAQLNILLELLNKLFRFYYDVGYVLRRIEMLTQSS